MRHNFLFRWIASGIILLETAVSWKFRQGASYYRYLDITLSTSGPWDILCVMIIVVAALYYLYLRCKRNRTTEYGDSPWEIEARNLDIGESGESNDEKEKVEEKRKTTKPQQARNESHEKTRQVKESTKGKIKKE